MLSLTMLSRLICLALTVSAPLLPTRSAAAASATADPAAAPDLAFGVHHMDPTVDPRADFAAFAFGGWLKRVSIPADLPSFGAFAELNRRNQELLRAIAEEAAARPGEPGSPEQLVGDFYAGALDQAAIDAAGVRPIEADLARIAAIRTTADVVRTTGELHAAGFPTLFGASVGADAKQSSVNALYLRQGGLSLPNRDYYSSPQFETVRQEFKRHIVRLLVLAGDSETNAQREAEIIYDLESALANASRTAVELRDRERNYNKVTTADFAARYPELNFPAYLAAAGFPTTVADVIVGQPEFFAALAAMLPARPVEHWRAYLRYTLLRDAAPDLGRAFEAEHFAFFSTTISGTPQQPPRWRKAIRTIDGSVGEALGRLYVERHYPPEARARMAELVENVKTVFRGRLQKLEWMSEETRQKALQKFDRFYAKIGHTDTWRDYREVTVRRDDYFGSLRSARSAEWTRQAARIGQPTDRMEWRMTPPTVNAYFSPAENTINFPAGILQPPYFDVSKDDAVNYGAIGAVIGHEITHGFDDQGRKSDADGNLVDWWQPEDAARFTERATKLVEQYGTYEPLPGLKVNGALSLGENIADLGGISIAFEALQLSLAGKPRPLIDGFTPEQRFFLAWAQQWRSQFRESAMRRQVAVGPHSPGMFRAVGPLVNTDAFFEAFGIKEGDPMWRRPEDRVRIW